MPLNSSLSQQQCLSAITAHSAGFAEDAAGDLDADETAIIRRGGVVDTWGEINGDEWRAI